MSRAWRGWFVWVGGIALVACTDGITNGINEPPAPVITEPPAPVQLAFTVQPSNVTAGAVITPPVQVAAHDSSGKLVTGFRDSVTVALAGNPPPGTLSGTTVVTALNGVATFSDLSIAQVSAGYTLIASAGGLTGVTSVPFSIAKPPPPPVTLRVTTTTTGFSFDPDGYRVCVDPRPDFDFGYFCTTDEAVGVNSGVSVSVAPGIHAVVLDELAPNCTVSEVNPQSTIDVGAVTEVSFAIACVAAGAVHVTTVTTGIDLDPSYGVCVDPSGTACAISALVPPNSAVTVPGVLVGPQTVTLHVVATNCTVSGSATRAVTVPQDGTVDVAFDVDCVVAERIAFLFDGTIVVSRADGSEHHGVIPGFAPAWSPSGARLAYECGQDICAINADSTGLAQLTVDAVGNHHPTWAPDGSKIAFAATHAGVTDLYVMAANGSVPCS